jgi:hypothetical protein
MSEAHGAVTALELGANEERFRVVTPDLLLISNHIQFRYTIIFGRCCLLGCDAVMSDKNIDDLEKTFACIDDLY